jgi:hypothetical protein
LVSATATSQQLDGIQAAQALWRDRGVPALGLRAGATLEVVSNPPPLCSMAITMTTKASSTFNTDLENDSALAIVIAHELGHAFGLTHVTDRVSS